MKRRDPIIISAQDYYDPCLNLDIFFEKEDGYEMFCNWSAPFRDLINKGFMYQLKCQPGLILGISRQDPSTDFSISNEEKTNYVRLFFILGEGFFLRLHHNQERETTFCSNQGYLTYARSCRRELSHLPAKPFCMIGIMMEPWFIKRFSQGIAGGLARKIEEMLALQNEGEFFRHPVCMTPSIRVCIHEILGCPYVDARRHLFLASKTLELMMFSFNQLNPDKGRNISCFDLATGSRNFVHKARDIMISDIKNPPSLTELSKRLGVNKTTLTKCFSKVYGVTIFNYLRTFRLEESKRLLQAGNRSVTEIAFKVGYAQQRTFTKEFKKYFGNTPSHYLG
ncbi:AraC family transcriptional regulator [uncultured Desulfobacter sp.]|uniref:helix-turn-helix transcriptional regulator n=2 Tax=uncultured Desulfobacter sp. TaxID=240139 RepID=UPI0029F4A8E6|nr:AraC family transcriptional regulator [uncultured Desulfobacter sp.]